MPNPAASISTYNRLLLLVAGLGGLLYGVDVGIIGGALPYLEATSGLSAGQLSIIVAAVLLGSVISTLFAGILADWMGRKPLMILSGVVFVVSIPMIALAHGYGPLFFGRLLQGVSGGFVGVVVPLYLAECLTAQSRGRGTGIFQWLLTLGIVLAALIGIYYSYRVEEVIRTADAATIFAFKDQAWRHIFWISLVPGLLFVAGGFLVAESPRWLFRQNRKAEARQALLRSRTEAETADEMAAMEHTASNVQSTRQTAGAADSLLRRKYLLPFVLACLVLFFNTATGINSIIGYNTNILLQSGLSDLAAHWGYVIFTVVNFSVTVVGLLIVDRKGRKFLLSIGTFGATVALVCVALLFMQTERANVDVRQAVQSRVAPDQTLSLPFTQREAASLLNAAPGPVDPAHASLIVTYSYGGFTGASNFVRSDEAGAKPITIARENAVPANRVEAIFQNPLADLGAAQTAPLRIERASMSAIPSAAHGWLVALALYGFMACFAFGPGVCVWLALSELMPTRIRSNGMSVALVINQLVSTTLAAIFLPVVSKFGYSFMFLVFAIFTAFYFLTARFLLPETKGKTLEEIEEYFEGSPAQRL